MDEKQAEFPQANAAPHQTTKPGPAGISSPGKMLIVPLALPWKNPHNQCPQEHPRRWARQQIYINQNNIPKFIDYFKQKFL